ncbi:hypothetical protein EHF33_16205 (plasmid) [Deinococcus psychrotolerans]|uniref:Lipoprotein n=1 Tax=Deinococcus psychrotolerans TaxID=2489213 RepID=A0A3G8YGI9_9DEIO|nr:hypothetical protein [Deinococcus psychrotolerans]AZI44459.1 hypothetical protein EHF33_16205 [Deinococcus psychrotolerans]
MPTKKMLKFIVLTLLAFPLLGSCGYPNNVVPRQPIPAILNMTYSPASACPDMALINKSSEIVVFTASGGVTGYGAQQLQVYIQPGSAQALATAFAPPYTQQTLTSKGGSQSDTGNVSYSLGVRCSATSPEVTKSFTLLGDTTHTLTLVEDSAAPGGVTLSLN